MSISLVATAVEVLQGSLGWTCEIKIASLSKYVGSQHEPSFFCFFSPPHLRSQLQRDLQLHQALEGTMRPWGRLDHFQHPWKLLPHWMRGHSQYHLHPQGLRVSWTSDQFNLPTNSQAALEFGGRQNNGARDHHKLSILDSRMKENLGLDPSHHLRRYPSRGAWRVPSPGGGHEGEKGLKPPWSPLEAPLKPFSSPLQAPLKPPSPWSPLQALLKPPWSPSQAPLKPPSSKPPSSPSQAPLKPPWSPSQAPLKPPWTGLKPRKPPSSPSEAPVQPPGSPSKPFPKGSFM